MKKNLLLFTLFFLAHLYTLNAQKLLATKEGSIKTFVIGDKVKIHFMEEKGTEFFKGEIMAVAPGKVTLKKIGRRDSKFRIDVLLENIISAKKINITARTVSSVILLGSLIGGGLLLADNSSNSTVKTNNGSLGGALIGGGLAQFFAVTLSGQRASTENGYKFSIQQ